jgi:hypothetical protein
MPYHETPAVEYKDLERVAASFVLIIKNRNHGKTALAETQAIRLPAAPA